MITATTEVATRTPLKESEGVVKLKHQAASLLLLVTMWWGYDGQHLLLEQAHPHMWFSSFSSMRLTGYALQLYNYRSKGMGLGRPTLAVRARSWGPEKPTRKTLLLQVLSI